MKWYTCEKDDIEGFADAMEMARNIHFKDVKLSEKFECRTSIKQLSITHR